jgi:hypothetical protein
MKTFAKIFLSFAIFMISKSISDTHISGAMAGILAMFTMSLVELNMKD